jgi:hypothetical protein
MLEILRFFSSDIKEGESWSSFYVRKIMVLRTMHTSRQAVDLANILENQFFIQTLIRGNTVYVFPRCRYEHKVLGFLDTIYGRVEKNGNEIVLREPKAEAFNRNDVFVLRSMRINSNRPVPGLNYILRQNGLIVANKTTNERFLCTITFTEFERVFGTSVNVGIDIIDRKEEVLLLSHTLSSHNYPKFHSSAIIASMKNELADFMRTALPAFLINY